MPKLCYQAWWWSGFLSCSILSVYSRTPPGPPQELPLHQARGPAMRPQTRMETDTNREHVISSQDVFYPQVEGVFVSGMGSARLRETEPPQEGPAPLLRSITIRAGPDTSIQHEGRAAELLSGPSRMPPVQDQNSTLEERARRDYNRRWSERGYGASLADAAAFVQGLWPVVPATALEPRATAPLEESMRRILIRQREAHLPRRLAIVIPRSDYIPEEQVVPGRRAPDEVHSDNHLPSIVDGAIPTGKAWNGPVSRESVYGYFDENSSFGSEDEEISEHVEQLSAWTIIRRLQRENWRLRREHSKEAEQIEQEGYKKRTLEQESARLARENREKDERIERLEKENADLRYKNAIFNRKNRILISKINNIMNKTSIK